MTVALFGREIMAKIRMTMIMTTGDLSLRDRLLPSTMERSVPLMGSLRPAQCVMQANMWTGVNLQ